MKKIFLTSLILWIPYLMLGQTYSNNQKAKLAGSVDSLIHKYLQLSTLSSTGEQKQNLNVINQLKNLFTTGAVIFDDINAQFTDSVKVYSYKLEEKTRNEYFNGLFEEFPGGLLINPKRINVSYSNLNEGYITVALERTISGIAITKGYNFMNEDTLLIKINIQPDSTVKISQIKALGSNLKVLNDQDNDGIINTLDGCPDKAGPEKLKGCPDRDEDGVPDWQDECPDNIGSVSNKGCPASTFAYKYVFSGAVGLLIGRNKIDAPVSGFNYRTMDNTNSEARIENPGMKAGISINANIAYYFGKKTFNKNTGISVGIIYARYVSAYGVGGSKYYFKANDTYDDYRRIITIVSGSKENVSATLFQIPLQLKLKRKLGNKLAGEIGAGPALTIFQTRSEFEGKINYEGVYHFNPVTDRFEYEKNYDPSDPDISDVLLIGKEINDNLPPDQSVASTLYTQLGNVDRVYDFAYKKENVSSSKTGTTRIGLSFNAAADVFYHLTAKTAIKAGAVFMYAPLNNKKGKYSGVDKTTDPYNSIFTSNAKSKFIGYGVNVGLLVGF